MKSPVLRGIFLFYGFEKYALHVDRRMTVYVEHSKHQNSQMFFEDLFTYTINLSDQTWIPIQHFVRICFDSSLVVSAASVLFMLPVLPMNIRIYIGSCPIFLRNSLSGNKNTVTKKGRSNSSGICRSETTWQVSLGLLCQNFPCHSNCVVYSSLDLIGLVHGQKIMPFASDLFSPDVREDILIVGISRRCFDCTSHVLTLYFPYRHP